MSKVVKFGGSSLASAVQFKKVKAIMEADSTRKFVVPSAPGKRFATDRKVTDMIYEYYDLASSGYDMRLAGEDIRGRFLGIVHGLHLNLDLTKEFQKIEENFRKGYGRDYAASRGEYLNGIILAEYLQIPFIDAAEVICFDENGNFLPERTNDRLKERLEGVETAVIPGYYGAQPDGSIRTFSRGGSDITGSLVSRAVVADLYENWTDVSGFLLADPRIVENPLPISVITYRELHELSCMGASVLHEDAVYPVKMENIPINIRNTNRPEDPGTMIVGNTERRPSHKITGIAGKKGYCAVNISERSEGEKGRTGNAVMSMLDEKNIPYECIPTEENKLSILMPQERFADVEKENLFEIGTGKNPAVISLEEDLALVAVGVRGERSRHKVAGRVSRALEGAHISIMAMDRRGGEPTTLVGVKVQDFEPAVRAIYDNFIPGDPHPSENIHLYNM